MDEIFSDFELVKVNDTLNYILQKLTKNGYILDKSYYILDIYMINKNILDSENSFNRLKEVPDYLILRDYNNDKKEILLFNNEAIKGKLQGLFTTKYIVQNLGYEQMFNINKDIYFYTNGNNIITIVDIKDIGIHIDKSSIDETIENLSFDYSNEENNDYINEAFLEYLDNRKRGNV